MTWQLVRDVAWNVEALFDVDLELTNAARAEKENRREVLDPSLKTCRVAVLNTEKFPDDVHDIEDNIATIKHFLISMWNNYPSESRWGLFWKTFPALTFIANQEVNLRLFTYLTEATENHAENVDGYDRANYVPIITLYAFCFTFIFLIGCFADIQFGKLKLGGKSKTFLRSASLSTMVQLTQANCEVYDAGKLLKIIDDQVDGALEAFFNLFKLFSNFYIKFTPSC